jgi:hypothetical protein
MTFRLRMTVVSVVFLSVQVDAQTVMGKYAGEFISIGVGGRALAMGSAFVGVASDVSAGYWNPAALARIEYPQLMLMHDELFGSLVNHDYGAVALPVGRTATLGLSLIRLGVDDIPDTRNAGLDVNGNLTTDPNLFYRTDPSRVTYFSAADWALYLTYARRHSECFSYGANVKMIVRDLGDHSAWGLGFDVGVWYTPWENLSLGLNVQDVTRTLIVWDTGRNELISPALRLGAAYGIDALGGRFLPAADFSVRFENRRSASTFSAGAVSVDVCGGLEYLFKSLVALRVGYTDVKQFTLGAGLYLPKVNIDYAFARFGGGGELGNTHRVSLLFTLESADYKRAGD